MFLLGSGGARASGALQSFQGSPGLRCFYARIHAKTPYCRTKQSKSLFEHATEPLCAQNDCSSMLLGYLGARNDCSSMLRGHLDTQNECSSMLRTHLGAQMTARACFGAAWALKITARACFGAAWALKMTARACFEGTLCSRALL